ncbi:TIGR03619 family F420-dependent LLM class oxidoreductase [Nocardioides sp. dk4132]|uniref:LLM class F420-dependent oxidoreductase n=1 Tax=unclassified Nocardioides TaxID=2615069 RepID=UPI001294F36C|nr:MULTISPECIES: LLM class F420-dependent oxidoreductase [unclassified Nocardioides]MQW76199.1 TIGR03619 family F420-dependent LLM class oxidoreductase [Nocardioides sp. dk4132]QGA09027.1 TIGR03619 family F420-dependent LLM class oxidoreductase [Nocardioides sp. dk884]
MRHGVSLFTSDRGITPATAARAAEERGFDTFYVPEHTHIPVRRTAAHPATGGAELPDDRYLRTLDPWVALASAMTVTSRIQLATSVALPVESDPITLAKTIASLDHLSGGRVCLGAGFGWNTDEMADHGVPTQRRRTVLREYVEAMRALWTQEEASYQGEFVSFEASWAWPKPAQEHLPVIIGAQAGPRTFAWIAAHADGWLTTPLDTDLPTQVRALHEAWAEAGRSGEPDVRALRPTLADLETWDAAGVHEAVWSVPDSEETAFLRYLDQLTVDLGL